MLHHMHQNTQLLQAPAGGSKDHQNFLILAVVKLQTVLVFGLDFKNFK